MFDTEKRKRKNDDPQPAWVIIFSAMLIATVIAGISVFFIADEQTIMREASVIYTEADAVNRIGLFVGHHHFDGDDGAVCDDGLTEKSINASIATALEADLTEQGYHVDLFYRYDDTLIGYRGDLLMAIHAYGCHPEMPSGFRVENIDETRSLDRCLAYYRDETNLEQRYDAAYMDRYYRFDEAASTTPTLIMEVGMLEADRDLLTNGQATIVRGLSKMVNCISPLQTDDITR